jgi:hypothetical protein
MASLRSNYRRYYSIVLKKSSELSVTLLADNKDFTEEYYKLYEQVENHAKIKIDKLPLSFFRNNFFKILIFKDKNNTPAGFVQLLENGDELVFEFTGFDYAINMKCRTYHRMLLEIIRYAINNGFKKIDFGQTADDAKLRLGCRYEYLHLYLHHSNPFVNFIYRMIAPLIDYKPLKPNLNVFRAREKP